MQKLGSAKGFTLVELLVVIAIIGVLSTLVLLQLGVARAKARDAKRIADVNQLRTAVELYFDDHGGSYPGDDLCAPTAAGCVVGTPTDWGGGDITDYLSARVVPVDPLSGNAYPYAWNESLTATARKSAYHVYAELERLNAPAFAGDTDIDSAVFTDPSPLVLDLNDAADEVCTDNAAQDCSYDLGQAE